MPTPPPPSPEQVVVERLAVLRGLQEAVEYAPKSGPIAPDLLTVTVGGVTICAACAGRIIARGCGHLLNGCTRVWRGDGVFVVCCALCGWPETPEQHL